MTTTRFTTTAVQEFIDAFIRSEYFYYFVSERNSDFINYPERAAAVADAPEGCDPTTTRDVIEDWRDAFECYMRDRRGNAVDRFEAAVEAHFAQVEQWHLEHGSLDQATG